MILRIITLSILFAFICINIEAQENIKAKKQSFYIPAKGIISSMFGWRRTKSNGKKGELKFHRGIDIAGRYKSPVLAAEDGVVVFAAWNGGYGRFLEIKHDNGYTTAYGHFRKIMVEKGDTVSAGQIIGLMGNSGTTFSTVGGHGVHVHFEIRNEKDISWKNPKGALNPVKYLKVFKNVEKYTKVDFIPEVKYMTVKQACYIDGLDIIDYEMNKRENKIEILRSLQAEMILPTDAEPLFFLSERQINYKTKTGSIYNGHVLTILDKIKAHNYALNTVSVSDNMNYREVNYKFEYKRRTNCYFAIQLEAHRKKLSVSELKSLEEKYGIGSMQYVEAEINNSLWYKYTTGIFDSLEEAKEYRKKLVSKNIIPRGGICKIVNNKAEITYW